MISEVRSESRSWRNAVQDSKASCGLKHTMASSLWHHHHDIIIIIRDEPIGRTARHHFNRDANGAFLRCYWKSYWRSAVQDSEGSCGFTAEIRAERRPRAVLRVAPVAAEVGSEVGGGRGDHHLPRGLTEQPGAVRRRALAACSQRSLLEMIGGTPSRSKSQLAACLHSSRSSRSL